MRKIPTVLIYAKSNIGHLQQLYAGFSLLHRAGDINLVQLLKKRPGLVDSAEPHLRDARLAHCSVEINGKYRVYYDMHDSWEVDQEALECHDFYFKRSLQFEELKKLLSNSHKIRPYGLNYEVISNPPDLFALRRSLLAQNLREFVTGVGWSTGLANLWQFVPSLGKMEDMPPENAPNKIIFMARTWDPNQNSAYLDHKRKLDRDSINHGRANCIRALRNAFGEKFLGGFAPSELAKKYYPDLLLHNNSYNKKNYIEILRASTIGIATAGLHGSLGWKMAEYVAFSRAIVSENFNTSLPGIFSDGSNYLSFSTPEECVNQVQRLLNDNQLRMQMMRKNRAYYLDFLHPKALVAKSLAEVLNS